MKIKNIILLFAIGLSINIQAEEWKVSPDDLDGTQFTYKPFSASCNEGVIKRPKTTNVKKFLYNGQPQIIFGAPDRNIDYQLYFDSTKIEYYNETKTRKLRFLNNNVGIFQDNGKDQFCFDIKR